MRGIIQCFVWLCEWICNLIGLTFNVNAVNFQRAVFSSHGNEDMFFQVFAASKNIFRQEEDKINSIRQMFKVIRVAFTNCSDFKVARETDEINGLIGAFQL